MMITYENVDDLAVKYNITKASYDDKGNCVSIIYKRNDITLFWMNFENNNYMKYDVYKNDLGTYISKVFDLPEDATIVRDEIRNYFDQEIPILEDAVLNVPKTGTIINPSCLNFGLIVTTLSNITILREKINEKVRLNIVPPQALTYNIILTKWWSNLDTKSGDFRCEYQVGNNIEESINNLWEYCNGK